MKTFLYGASNGANKVSKQVEKKVEETFVHPLSTKHDKYKGLLELVTDYGYPIEKYFYETKDHYVNCVFRVSGQRGTKPKENWGKRKPVIIYQHGFLDSSASVCLDGLESMVFYFADRGFDVWMNNNRGNRFSRHHVFYDPNVHDDYWDFSFQDMAAHDQPALFEFVLGKTGVQTLTYIGHSQGTMQMFAALSENLEFFKTKINLAIMLAPVTRIKEMNNSHVRRVKDSKNFVALLETLQGKELLPTPVVESKLSGSLVSAFSTFTDLAIEMGADIDSSLVSQRGRDNFVGHFPSGTSFRTGDHFRQLLQKGTFQKYDFGVHENFQRYGQLEPPHYDLSKIRDVQIALFCGSGDKLASPGDYKWLKEEQLKYLDQQGKLWYKEYENWGHMAFLLPANAKESHFKDMFELMMKYNPDYKAQNETSNEDVQRTTDISDISYTHNNGVQRITGLSDTSSDKVCQDGIEIER